MSGTSVDAIDAVALKLPSSGPPVLVDSVSHPWPKELQQQLRELPSQAAPSWADFLSIDRRVAEEHAEAVSKLRKHLPAKQNIAAIGFHGQTVFHATGENNSLQTGSPAHLAAISKLPVVGDFRRADMAHGGQGAPFAPLFHNLLWGQPHERIGVLNLGGIANLSVLASNTVSTGFDTGPANGLMDAWCQTRLGCHYDHNGNLAQQGRVIPKLLNKLASDPYFLMEPPKATGREYFSLAWLEAHLSEPQSDHDILRTLVELTVRTVADQVRRQKVQKLILVGGGAENPFLVELLATALPDISISSSSDFGWPTQTIEAALFAWLAERHCSNQALDYRNITGARIPCRLGAYYPSP